MVTPRARPRVALVAREVAPLGGGGIGRFVAALSALLADDCEVTLFTTSRHRRNYERLRKRSPELLPPARVVFVKEPRSWDARNFFDILHAWSARVHEALLAEYGADGPELIEFCDFCGEGCVTLQAKRTGAPQLADTRISVRAHGTAEMYDVLDGFLAEDRERSFVYELERYALRHADDLLWAGGDILGTYERFYGADALAPARLVRHPFAWDAQATAARSAAESGPLRLLYLGRLERRKGVRGLIEALLGLDRTEWELTLVGGDTDTGPLGTSMRALLESEIVGDERIRLIDEVARTEIPALIDAHDVVVVPSLWECWPYAALEALERGRPLLATATGGMTELVRPGVTGWLAAGPSPAELGAAIAPLVEEPERARSLAGADARGVFEELCDADSIRADYLELCEPPARAAPATSDEPPLVSIVIPYFEMDRYIAEAVASAAAQTHPSVEIVVVNDGSFRVEDRILLELERRYGLVVVAQPNAGLGAARNFGIAVARGEYVLPLDADNLLEPDFIAKALAAFAADAGLAYVTSWLQYLNPDASPWKGTDEGLSPLGNSSRAVERFNLAGDAVALFPRAIFDRFCYSTDLHGFEDWALYRELRRHDLIGQVIPERLIGYRLRDDSMMRAVSSQREQWVRQAIDAHLVEASVEWTAPAR